MMLSPYAHRSGVEMNAQRRGNKDKWCEKGQRRVIKSVKREVVQEESKTCAGSVTIRYGNFERVWYNGK